MHFLSEYTVNVIAFEQHQQLYNAHLNDTLCAITIMLYVAGASTKSDSS